MLNRDINNKKSNQKKIERSKNLPPVGSELFRRSDYFIEDKVGFQSGSQNRSGYKLAIWILMSAVIDALIVLSISCFAVIIFSFLMKTGARDLIKYFYNDKSVVKLFAFLFVISFWMYLIVMRLFMGASFGEWSCQLRLGQPLERREPYYGLKVVARTTLIFATGVFIVPLLSILSNRDIAGEVSGVKLYSLV